MADRTLTEAEVVLVKRLARRGRIWFWLLLPFGVLAIAVGLLVAVSSFLDHAWFLGLVGSASTLVVVLVFYLFRTSLTWYGAVTCSTPVVTKTGVLRLMQVGRSFMLAVDDIAVIFVSKEVRQAVQFDERCVVEVVYGAPVLVITARPG